MGRLWLLEGILNSPVGGRKGWGMDKWPDYLFPLTLVSSLLPALCACVPWCLQPPYGVCTSCQPPPCACILQWCLRPLPPAWYSLYPLDAHAAPPCHGSRPIPAQSTEDMVAPAPAWPSSSGLGSDVQPVATCPPSLPHLILYLNPRCGAFSPTLNGGGGGNHLGLG